MNPAYLLLRHCAATPLIVCGCQAASTPPIGVVAHPKTAYPSMRTTGMKNGDVDVRALLLAPPRGQLARWQNWNYRTRDFAASIAYPLAANQTAGSVP